MYFSQHVSFKDEKVAIVVDCSIVGQNVIEFTGFRGALAAIRLDLDDKQFGELTELLVARRVQIAARQARENAANGCRCIEVAGDWAECPVHHVAGARS